MIMAVSSRFGLPGKASAKQVIKGINTLNKKLDTMITMQSRGSNGKFGGNVSVVVGFTAPYAVYQHEILWYNHPRGGQAKYLEQPANEMRPVMASIIQGFMTNRTDILPAMIAAATVLKEKARMLAPIKTGALRKSAFVAVR